VRALFLVLLLANLLFLAWTRWVAAPGARTSVAPAADSTPLRPIKLQKEAAGGVGDPGEAGAIAGAACVSVGPFAEQAQADAASASLRRLGFTARLRSATDEVRVGHWVRIADLATPADATLAIATLQAAGLADAYAITDEGPGNVVSIGVYSDPARAAAVAETVSRAGFTPQTTDRMRTLEVFWLDVDRQANGGIPELEDAGEPPADGLPLELRVCPSAVGAPTATELTAETGAG
jgi:hypothetical protein